MAKRENIIKTEGLFGKLPVKNVGESTNENKATPRPENTSSGSTLEISLPRKSPNKKLETFQLDEELSREFSEITKKLGYKKVEVWTELARAFVENYRNI